MTGQSQATPFIRTLIGVVFLSGLITGTLDALFAIVIYNVNPVRMFQYIASGAFGPEAFKEGGWYAFIGILIHYIIATSWCLLFAIIFPYLHQVAKHWIIKGIIWGLIIWCVMNLLILPLSAIDVRAFNLTQALIGASIIIVAVGLPVSFLVTKLRSDRRD
jgi:hypothetical protein